MTSAYPGALDPLKTNVNGATDTLASVPHDALHNDQAAAIKAVQATLGVDPQGTYATVAARLAASELADVGSPQGVVTASPGTYYTDTAATNGAWRWLKTSGSGNTGWIVIFGDTGWRDVTALFGAQITAGTIYVARTTHHLDVYVNGVQASSGSVSITLPSGFAAALSNVYVFPFINTSGAGLRLTSSNVLYLTGASTSSVSGSATVYCRAPWPTSLPGTSA